jgi:hypothetical protein
VVQAIPAGVDSVLIYSLNFGGGIVSVSIYHIQEKWYLRRYGGKTLQKSLPMAAIRKSKQSFDNSDARDVLEI